MKNEIKFKEFMSLLSETFDKPLSSALSDLYWKILEPFTDEQCEAAFKEIIYSSKFFPKPVDFVEILRGKKADRATEAWIEVLNAIKRIGNYESVKFSDPVIHSVLQVMGGWDHLASTMTMDEEKWKQKEFERLYQVMERRGNHPVYLPGTCEMQNTAAMIAMYEDRTGEKYEQKIIEIGFDEQIQIAIN
jgi:Domain of unknown function (DUF6475)